MSDIETDTARSVFLGRRRLLAAGGLSIIAAACSSQKDSAAVESNSTSSSSTSVATTPAPAETAAAATAPPLTDPPATGAPSSSVGVGQDTTFVAADFQSLATCVLLPEKTAGPFPLEEQFTRRDITEDYAGHPVRLGLRVLDQACAAVPGALVEIWHADATGDYSAFVDNGGGKDEGEGTTFMRGTQSANDEGIVEFLTVFPGWYSGRTPHIHLRVHLGDTTVLTSQLFFDEGYAAGVYGSGVYAEFGQPDTTNASDNIAGDAAAQGTIVAMRAGDTSRGAGTIGLLNLSIDPNAVSSGGGAGGPGGGPGGPPPPRPLP